MQNERNPKRNPQTPEMGRPTKTGWGKGGGSEELN